MSTMPVVFADALRSGGWVDADDTVMNYDSPHPRRPVDELVADLVTSLGVTRHALIEAMRAEGVDQLAAMLTADRLGLVDEDAP